MLTVIDTAELTEDVLTDLMDDRCAVVWCRRFIEPEQASAIADQLLERCAVTAYANIETTVGRIGQSLYETLGQDGRTDTRVLATYLSSAQLKIDEIRSACAPYTVPIERFYRRVDALFGAELATYDGQDLFSGTVRIIPSGQEVVPHNDSFSRDVPELDLARNVDGQFAANIYLRLPDTGGELQLWDLRPSDQELALLPTSKAGYGNDRHYFALPDMQLRPGIGDLICFRGNLMHAVSRAGTGVRVNMNCFAARKRDGSLIYWS